MRSQDSRAIWKTSLLIPFLELSSSIFICRDAPLAGVGTHTDPPLWSKELIHYKCILNEFSCTVKVNEIPTRRLCALSWFLIPRASQVSGVLSLVTSESFLEIPGWA